MAEKHTPARVWACLDGPSKFDAVCYWLRDHPHAVGYAAIIATILFVGRLEIIPGMLP